MKTKYIKYNKSEKGQTVIETALMMIFLLVLFFGIAEISRAWWLKNQLNNAARVAVRVAIVDSALTLPGVTLPLTASCRWTSGSCSTSSTNEAIGKACASITNHNLCAGGGASAASVTLGFVPPDTNPVSSGKAINVTVTGNFVSVVPNLAGLSFGLFQSTYSMPTSASMRYE